MSDPVLAIPMPANETREHFLLKQVGLIWLKAQGCQFVATEIDGMGGDTEADTAPVYRMRYDRDDGRSKRARESRIRTVADVVGVQREFGGFYTIRLIEVKVSRADFFAGYCTGAHYAYVMTPAGLVEPDELEPGVGLLEVDLSAIEAKRDPKGVAKLVTVKRKPKRQERDTDDGAAIVEAIAAKHTNNAVWKNPWLIQQREGGRREQGTAGA